MKTDKAFIVPFEAYVFLGYESCHHPGGRVMGVRAQACHFWAHHLWMSELWASELWTSELWASRGPHKITAWIGGRLDRELSAVVAAGIGSMIRHIVFFRAKNPKDYQAIYQGLKILEGIPDCRYFEVGCNLKTDEISPASPDFVVYGEFEDQAQLDDFKRHALYQKSIEAVRPLRDMRMAADFLSNGSEIGDD